MEVIVPLISTVLTTAALFWWLIRRADRRQAHRLNEARRNARGDW